MVIVAGRSTGSLAVIQMDVWDVLPNSMEVVTILALLGAFEGTRRVSTGDRTRSTYALLIAAVGWCVLRAGISLYVSSTTESLAEMQRKLPYKQLPTDWGKAELTPTEREAKSRGYAVVAFLGTGTLYRYFALDGTETLFVPTQQQLRDREAAAITFHDLDGLSVAARNNAIGLVIYALLASGVGLAVGLSKGRRTK